jgi:hypothetical protein
MLPAAQRRGRAVLTLVHTWFQPSWIVPASLERRERPDAARAGKRRGAAAVFGFLLDGWTTWPPRSRRRGSRIALLAAMASLALLLTAVGIFALVPANIVAQRTRDPGSGLASARRSERR